MSAGPGILYVIPWPIDAVGGVNQVVTNLIRQGAETRLSRPVLLENCPATDIPREVPVPYLPVVVRFRFRTPFDTCRPLRTTLAFLLKAPVTLIRLRALLRHHSISAVNVHYPTLAALHFRLLRLMGLYQGRLALSFHGLDIRAAAESGGLERLAWLSLLRGADHITACSHALAKEIAAFYPGCRDRIVVIHNGVAPDTLLTPAPNAPVPPALKGLRYVLNVGTFEHKKGQDVLLEAFRSLAGDFPDLHLVLVGRTTPFLNALKDRLSALGLARRVLIFADVPHEQIAPFFASATAFCLPSRAEPFGIVLLEAALFDLPVVATSVGGIGEIVRGGQDGALVPPGDPVALATALRAILTDTATAGLLAESLKRRVMESFTWRTAFLRYLELA